MRAVLWWGTAEKGGDVCSLFPPPPFPPPTVDRRHTQLGAQPQGAEGEGDDPYAGMNLNRNAPCPCGSGAKYKHCHGALA